jgi:hypothetical protein
MTQKISPLRQRMIDDMASHPRQHVAGDSEVIVLPRRTGIDHPALTHLSLKSHRLFVRGRNV